MPSPPSPLASFAVKSAFAFWGVKIIIAGIDQGQGETPTDLELDLRQRQIRFRKLTRGSMIALFGSTIILGSLYFMTSQPRRRPLLNRGPGHPSQDSE